MITAVTLLMLAGTAHAERFPAAPSLAETTWLSGAPVAVPTEGVAVVELWATWCGPCIEQLPHLQGLAAHYAGQVHFAAISDEPRRTVEAFWSTRGRFLGEPVFSVGTDPSGETSRRYQRIDQASSIPRSYIVHDGEVVWSGHPAYLDGVLEAVVGDRWDAARAAYLPRAAGRVEDYFTAIKRGKGQEAAAIGAEVVRYADTQPGLLNDMAWRSRPPPAPPRPARTRPPSSTRWPSPCSRAAAWRTRWPPSAAPWPPVPRITTPTPS